MAGQMPALPCPIPCSVPAWRGSFDPPYGYYTLPSLFFNVCLFEFLANTENADFP
jgi:hypothetical protein